MSPDEVRKRIQAGGVFAQAVSHPSFANERGIADNQRLEFLGDAVLQLTVSELLYRRFPHLREGELTRFRAALVREPALAARGRALRLGALIRLGAGEPQKALRDQDSILCDTYEAVIGALFLEDGFDVARAFVATEVDAEIEEIGAAPWLADPKTVLQESLQERGRVPSYHVLRVEGPDHRPQFEVAALDGDVELGRGVGRSKRLAEEAAAKAALGEHPELTPNSGPAQGRSRQGGERGPRRP